MNIIMNLLVIVGVAMAILIAVVIIMLAVLVIKGTTEGIHEYTKRRIEAEEIEHERNLKFIEIKQKLNN